MRAEHDNGQIRFAALPPPDNIAGCIHPHRQARFPHQVPDVCPAGEVSLTKRHPADTAFRIGAES